MLGLGLGGAALAVCSPVLAARYTDNSGLSFGRFVWHPTAQRHGPVLLVASHRFETLHVYRGGVQIGIAPARVSDAARRSLTYGVYRIEMAPSQKRVRGRRGQATVIAWSGVPLHLQHGEPSDGASNAALEVPVEFARLLAEATGGGATLVIADERSIPAVVNNDWPPIAPAD